MGKFDIEPVMVRQSFSHARTKPLVVEKKRRATDKKAALLCPSCGSKMKLIRSSAKLTASCPDCGAHRT
jgi:Zn finger protein HypA/HybF involved in hydrogenase expression